VDKVEGSGNGESRREVIIEIPPGRSSGGGFDRLIRPQAAATAVGGAAPGGEDDGTRRSTLGTRLLRHLRSYNLQNTSGSGSELFKTM